MKHKIVGIDLDGTLLTPLKKISRKDLRALANFIDQGGIPAIVTGRSPVSAMKYLHKIEKFADSKLRFIACFNGAYIYDQLEDKEYKNLISNSIVRELFEYIKQNKLSAWFYTESSMKQDAVHSYRFNFPVTSKLFKRLNLINWKDIPNSKEDISCYKINIMAKTRKTISKVYDSLKQKYNAKLSFAKSAGKLIEITNKNVDKGSAIQFIASKSNFNSQDIAFLGDSFNDIPGFAASDRSFAIKPKNKKVINFATDLIKRKKNAVAFVINKYLINETGKGKVQIVVTDLDGTLLVNETKEIIPETKKLVKATVDDKNLFFAVATGRNIDDIKLVIKNLGIKNTNNCFGIANNGSIIYDFKNDKYIYQNCIYPELAQQILDEIIALNKSGKYGQIGCYAHRVLDLKNIDFKKHTQLYGYNLKFVQTKLSWMSKNFTKNNWYEKDFNEMSEDLKSANVCKFVIYTESPHQNQKLLEHFEEMKMDVTLCRSSKINIEINANGASKGNAVVFLAQKLGININQVITIGDEENDISMLSVTRNSFTLQSSKDEVKQTAGNVLKSKPSYIVKDTLEKMVFKK